MPSRVVFAMVIGLAVMSKGGQAREEVRPFQDVPFGLGIGAPAQQGVFKETITLFVMPLAERGRGPLGRVRVSVSDGLSVVSGDTAFTVSVERATEHRLEIRCLRPGTHHVTGTLVIDSSDGFQDYFELDLPISVTGDTLSPGRPDILRAESMIGGRRLRYAGGWLVPMDEGDRFDNREFVRRGTRARA